jgi:hypothetical protein
MPSCAAYPRAWPQARDKCDSPVVQDQAITLPATPNSPEQFRETLARDITRWAEVVRRSGATVD